MRRIDSSTVRVDPDNTGFTQLSKLAPNTRYYYNVRVTGQPAKAGLKGTTLSFLTLSDASTLAYPQFNPKGLFNLAFENDALGGGETGFREDATDPAVNDHPFRGDIHGVLERAVFHDPALYA